MTLNFRLNAFKVFSDVGAFERIAMSHVRLLLIVFFFAASAESAFNAPRDVFFAVYTSGSPTTGLSLAANLESLNSSSFNPLYPTRIFIHGWKVNHNSLMPTKIKDAYLQKGNFNVILVDWGEGAKHYDYFVARSYIKSVADEVAKLVRFLVANNATSLDKLVMSGHSLGAHIAGFVGKQISNVYAIVGLDPAGPGFLYGSPSQRLAATDATIVQVIHTTASTGAWYTMGTCDFFMNSGFNGLFQPGCGMFDFGCSHGRAGDLFAESINSQKFAVSGTYMGGEPLARNAVGNYNLDTNSRAPFAKG